MTDIVRFTLNGMDAQAEGPSSRRLVDALRGPLHHQGVKQGCNAGDCGSCTVLVDGKPILSCLTALGQVSGRDVRTVEGLASGGALSRLQSAFLAHGAAQCGICTPAMLIAATALLERNPSPSEEQVIDAIGGVLCRCTGYRKIVLAILDAASASPSAPKPQSGKAVGQRLARVDGLGKITGQEKFGADGWPKDTLLVRAVRSPFARAEFEIGDLAAFKARHPGIHLCLTADDLPGAKSFGIYPTIKDQPVLAKGWTRYRGDPVLAIVGEPEAVRAIPERDLPVSWTELPPLKDINCALEPGAIQLHAASLGNILTQTLVEKGDAEQALASSFAVAEGIYETALVEHAYIEPEAGFAQRIGDRIEISACTQSPYMDRDEVALILGLEAEQVRVIPTGIGGGFGGKLDLSVQPLIALASWKLNKPVGMVYGRAESMMATTKRHPSRIKARFGCDKTGRLTAAWMKADLDTGAYASWGPTVAARIPMHASGPYLVPNVHATGRAIYTNQPPSGAFRGFGVPQAAIAQETLFDELAAKLGMDPLDFRQLNALKAGDATSSGHILDASAGLPACLDALRPRWKEWRAEAAAYNGSTRTPFRQGVGIACMWYGIGNTAMTNPASMQAGIDTSGRVTLYSGAVDIGQGSNTVMAQIFADALGVNVSCVHLVTGDTDHTLDAGKTSASRQTFVSGNAAKQAGEALRADILRLANAGADAAIAFTKGAILVRDAGVEHRIDLSAMPRNACGDVLEGQGYFDPPTKPLDAKGQGVPYASYAFAAQIAWVEVDCELGSVKVLRMAAAHDVGKAINPVLVEGQIDGGIAQGLGFALMEEFVPGRTESLHDYVIPAAGDVPSIEHVLIEDTDPIGPFGAKGIGEPALIPTAPAILNAIRHATGARLTQVPATPERVLTAIEVARKEASP
jgi:aldehyde oxidoreductase